MLFHIYILSPLRGTVGNDSMLSYLQETILRHGNDLQVSINTTCELVRLELDGWKCNVEQDEETGYDETVFERESKV